MAMVFVCHFLFFSSCCQLSNRIRAVVIAITATALLQLPSKTQVHLTNNKSTVFSPPLSQLSSPKPNNPLPTPIQCGLFLAAVPR